MNHIHPHVALERADGALALVFSALLAAVILVRVFGPGRMNLHRIQGAIAVYLLFAVIWLVVAAGRPLDHEEHDPHRQGAGVAMGEGRGEDPLASRTDVRKRVRAAGRRTESARAGRNLRAVVDPPWKRR